MKLIEQEFYEKTKKIQERYENIARNRNNTINDIRWCTMFGSLACSAIVAIIGTIFGWIHLNRIHGLQEKRGFWLGLLLALLLPIVAIWSGLLIVFVGPYPGGVTWTIGNLTGLAVSIYLIRTTYLWANK